MKYLNFFDLCLARLKDLGIEVGRVAEAKTPAYTAERNPWKLKENNPTIIAISPRIMDEIGNTFIIVLISFSDIFRDFKNLY